jgi:hypothetical protein
MSAGAIFGNRVGIDVNDQHEMRYSTHQIAMSSVDI